MTHSETSVRLFATDVEDTLLGDAIAPRDFQMTWESLPADRRPLLVYNSGRRVQEIQWLVLESRIPAPEFIIGSLGTEVHDPLDAQLGVEFEADIARGWDAGRIDDAVGRLPGARLQAEDAQGRHKRSWHWPRATAAELCRLEDRLQGVGLDVTVLYSNDVCLDVIPRAAGKGNALAWLCRRIGVALEKVVVAGAHGSNASMFALPGVRGIIVGNASAQLFAASRPHHPLIVPEKSAAGILSGLGQLGVLLELAPHA